MKTKITMVIILLVIAGGGGFFFVKYKENNDKRIAIETKQKNDEHAREQIIELLKNQVKAGLLDGDSAQFRDVILYESVRLTKAGGRYVIQGTICGDINGKNAYGGYIGYRPFISTTVFGVADAMLVQIYDPSSGTQVTEDFSKMQTDMCPNVVKNI